MFKAINPARTHRTPAALIGCTLLLLSACGGSGYGGSSLSGSTATGSTTGTAAACGASGCGSALITLTDARGDFLSYIVSITSVQLQTENGSSVETIPVSTKVDFAQLVSLSEVLSAKQVPAAEYVSAKLVLDFTNASITADDGTGTPVTLKPVDASGAPITGPQTVTVRLDDAHHLGIARDGAGQLALDFNLGVSNVVNLAAGTVTVAPTLVASVAAEQGRQARVRGSLASVNAGASDFILDVLPFHDEAAGAGQVTVSVDASTSYQINGTDYSGAAGLTALAAVPAGTRLAAFGALQPGSAATFKASRVRAGTSLEGAGQDHLSGTVIARTQTSLTLRSATWSKSDGDFDFERQDSTVTIGPQTAVSEEGHTGSFSVADISVGQRIEAAGVAAKGANGSIALDATSGQVHLEVTDASGAVTTLAAGTLTLSLTRLGGLPVSAFDFSGTGSAAAGDAAPAAYVIETGQLTQSGLSVAAQAQVLGFVTPFGSAPPDFTAETLIGAQAAEAELQIRFGTQGAQSVFTGLTSASTSLVLNPAALAAIAGGGAQDSGGEDKGSGSEDGDGNGPFIELGSQRIDVRKLTALTILPDAGRSDAVFTIGHAQSMLNANFNTFQGFVTQLSADLAGSAAVVAITASGTFDPATSTLKASHVAVLLAN